MAKDAFDVYADTPFILCKPNGDRVGEQRVTEKNRIRKFMEYDEISFKTYLKMDHKDNPYYADVKELMLIEIPEIGEYVITQLNVNSESDYNESKTCTALSSEVQLAQKYLELFTINMGTTESQDGIQLYNEGVPTKSLLHLVLEKCPDWTIGYVSTELRTVQRSFEVSREDVYSFLTTEAAQAFEAVFEFDTLAHEINVYKEEEYGQDINVALSYNNLLLSTDISSSTDDIKTCLTVTGDNDLNLREVNLGSDRIYNIDYFHDLSYMSQSLYDAYTVWREKYSEAAEDFTPQTTQRHQLVKQKNYQVSEKQPENPPDPDDGLTDEDWTEYSLNGLKEKKAANEQALAVSMKAGYGDPGNPEGTDEEKRQNQMYNEQYQPVYNRIQAIDREILVRQAQIDTVQTQIDSVDESMDQLVTYASINSNFTVEQQKELSKFIREDELSSSNYIVTDTMDEDERFEMLNDMLEYGAKELAKVAQPVLQFSQNMANIFLIPEFEGLTDKFLPGNYLYVILRDNYYVKARILTIEEDQINPENFNITFGNLMATNGGQLQDVTEALKLAQSAATTVSFSQSYWNEANKEATDISQMLADGLLAAGETQKTQQSDVEIDDRGMWVRYTGEDQTMKNTGIFIGGGQILFTDDDFKTISTALGKCTYTKNGVKYVDFGLQAQFVIAGYIAGSTIEGNDIIGGTITGSTFNNGNGTFSVDANGNLTAKSGKIAEYTISGAKLVGANVGLSSKSEDGWAFWSGSDTPGSAPYRVGHDGKLYATSAEITGKVTATSGTIGGWSIANNYIEKYNASSAASATRWAGMGAPSSVSDSNIAFAVSSRTSTSAGWTYPFRVNYDGSLTATKATITGSITANSGTIGGCSITDGKLYVSDAVYVKNGSTITTIGNKISSMDTLIAKKATITDLNATNARVSKLEADHVTTAQLNATNARVGNLEADHVTTAQLNATNARVGNLEADHVTTSQLNATNAKINNITGDTIVANTVVRAALGAFTNLGATSFNATNMTVNSGGSFTSNSSAKFNSDVSISGAFTLGSHALSLTRVRAQIPQSDGSYTYSYYYFQGYQG